MFRVRKMNQRFLSLTPDFSRVRNAQRSEKPFKRFSHSPVALTALKRGVNEITDAHFAFS
jgi:hypothetical protein